MLKGKKDKERQCKYRLNMSSQKKTALNQKRREKAKLKKQEELTVQLGFSPKQSDNTIWGSSNMRSRFFWPLSDPPPFSHFLTLLLKCDLV